MEPCSCLSNPKRFLESRRRVWQLLVRARNCAPTDTGRSPSGGALVPLQPARSSHDGVIGRRDLFSTTNFMTTTSRGLTLLDRATELLSQASSVEDLKEVRDTAEAARTYAKAAKLGLALQNRAAELKLRAERKAGTFLAALKLKGGNRRSKAQHAPLKLEELGLTRDQSTRWQLAATVPDEDFERYVRGKNQLGQEVTGAGLLRIAKSLHQRAAAPTRNGELPLSTPPREAVREGRAELLAVVSELKSQCAHLTELLQPLVAGQSPAYKLVERRFIGRLLGDVAQGIQDLERHLWNCG